MKQFMLAGVSSGVGKTTITLALLKALTNRGLSVQPYKVGPDYIDTAYHSRIANRTSRNIDSFMIPDDDNLKWSYEKWHEQADVALVEGVMGLYDGLGIDKDCASSSIVAKKLNIPVVLVIDGKATSTSAAAVVKGFVELDKSVDIIGAIINRVASKSHYELIKGAIEKYTDVKVLGYFPKNADVELPSRHLGLIPDVEMDNLEQKFSVLGDLAEQHIEIDNLLSLVDRPKQIAHTPFIKKDYSEITIAYALDDAFHFYYEDNLDLLKEQGVTLIPFSPLKDTNLPKADAYYFGGGYPEVFAKELHENKVIRQAILEQAQQHKPIYAECGGLMYLGAQLKIDDDMFDMVGVFDGVSVMTQRLKRFGYCQATVDEDSMFGKQGVEVRGHEFHHSVFETAEETKLHLEKYRDGVCVSSWTGGYQKYKTFASYLHVHFYQNQQLLFNWLEFIKEAKNGAC